MRMPSMRMSSGEGRVSIRARASAAFAGVFDAELGGRLGSEYLGQKKRLGRTFADETTEIIKSLRNPRSLTEALEYYELRCYWFEVVECFRKVMMAGVITVLVPVGSYEQLVVGTIVGIVLLGVLINQTPYKKRVDDVLAIICQLAILISLQLALLLKGMQDDQLIEYFFETEGVDPQEAARQAKEATDDLEAAVGGTLVAMTVLPCVLALLMVWTSFGMGRRAYMALAGCFASANAAAFLRLKKAADAVSPRRPSPEKEQKEAAPRRSLKVSDPENKSMHAICWRVLTHPCTCLLIILFALLLLIILLAVSYAMGGD